MTEDASARDWARTRTSDATAPPPARDEAVVEAVRSRSSARRSRSAGSHAGPAWSAPGPAAGPSDGHVDDADPAAVTRLPLLVQGLAAAGVAAVLAGASLLGAGALLVVVLLLQGVLAVAALALLGAPAARGGALVAGLAAVAADVVVLADDGSLDRLAGVVGLALVASLLHQLVRRGRSRVTESLADTSLAVLATVSAACLLAVDRVDGRLLLVALAAAGAALLVGRVVDRLVARPVLAHESTRGWPGLALSALVGTAVAVLLRDLDGLGLSTAAAAATGAAVVLTVGIVDLAVDLAAAELRPGRRDARRVRALRPTAALLPYALLGPVAALVGRLVLS